ncbi:MAG: leucine-rich repeat protein [Oscillospiraceae bacterium]|nr:leucine-rich repeat protein [Oscillospiraceae bacterium]
MKSSKKKTALIFALALTLTAGTAVPALAPDYIAKTSAEDTEPSKTGEYRGLKYEIYNNTVAITGWNTEYTESDAFIKKDGKGRANYISFPDEIEGLPVTKLVGHIDVSDSISEIKLGKNILTIQDHFFTWYSSSTSPITLTLPKDSNSIDGNIFHYYYSGTYHQNIAQINIPSYAENIGLIDNLYSEDSFLITWFKAIEVSERNNLYTSIDGVLYTKDKSELIICPKLNTLSEINIPDETVSIRSGAFKKANLPASLNIGKNVKNIGEDAFYQSSENTLTSLTLPASLNESAIGEGAFNNISFTNLIIPEYTKYVAPEFIANSKLKKITVAPENQLYSSDEKGVLYSKDKTELIKVPTSFETTIYTIPEGTVKIKDGAFTGTQNPTYLSVPETLTEIGSNTDTKIKTVEGYDNGPAAQWADDVLDAKYISNGNANIVIPDEESYSYDVNQDGIISMADVITLIKIFLK